jgi:hypothetical protein
VVLPPPLDRLDGVAALLVEIDSVGEAPAVTIDVPFPGITKWRIVSTVVTVASACTVLELAGAVAGVPGVLIPVELFAREVLWPVPVAVAALTSEIVRYLISSFFP